MYLTGEYFGIIIFQNDKSLKIIIIRGQSQNNENGYRISGIIYNFFWKNGFNGCPLIMHEASHLPLIIINLPKKDFVFSKCISMFICLVGHFSLSRPAGKFVSNGFNTS